MYIATRRARLEAREAGFLVSKKNICKGIPSNFAIIEEIISASSLKTHMLVVLLVAFSRVFLRPLTLLFICKLNSL